MLRPVYSGNALYVCTAQNKGNEPVVAKGCGPHICFLSTRPKRIKVERTKNGQVLRTVTGSALNVEFLCGQIFLRMLRLSPVIIFPPLLCSRTQY